MKRMLFVLFILPCWVKAFPMVRVLLFIAICFSVLFFIKEPEDDDGDVVILLYTHQALLSA